MPTVAILMVIVSALYWGLWFLGDTKAKKTDKNSIFVDLKIIKVEAIGYESSLAGVDLEPSYKITVEFNYGNKIIDKEVTDFSKYEVSTIIKGSYNFKNDEITLGDDTLKGIRNRSYYITLFIPIIFLAIALLDILFNGIIEKNFFTICWFILPIIGLLAGISLIKKGVRLSKGRTTIAKCIELAKGNRNILYGVSNLYYPIYEYYYNGVRKTLKGHNGASFLAKEKIGSQKKLILDNNGNAIEQSFINTVIIAGVAFIIAGIIFASLLLYII